MKRTSDTGYSDPTVSADAKNTKMNGGCDDAGPVGAGHATVMTEPHHDRSDAVAPGGDKIDETESRGHVQLNSATIPVATSAEPPNESTAADLSARAVECMFLPVEALERAVGLVSQEVNSSTKK